MTDNNKEEQKLKYFQKISWLNKNIFTGLHNLNNGFDTSSIHYFSEEQFEIVLQRVERYGIGIYGIEPWYRGEFFDVLTCEKYGGDHSNPAWYYQAFEEFKQQNMELQYSASYHVPDHYLDEMTQYKPD